MVTSDQKKKRHAPLSQLEHYIKINTPNSKLEAVIGWDRILKKLATNTDLWLGRSVSGEVFH